MGSGRQEQIAPGIQAANEILDTVLARSCVDDYAQDQVRILLNYKYSIISNSLNFTNNII